MVASLTGAADGKDVIPHKDLVARKLAHRMDPDQVTLVDAHESSAHLLGHLVQFAVEGIFLVLGNAGDLPAIRDEVENLCIGDAVGDPPPRQRKKAVFVWVSVAVARSRMSAS